MYNLNKLRISDINLLSLSISYFQLNYHNSKVHKELYSKFIEMVGDRYRKEIYCFLDNTLRCYRERSRGFKTPRDKKYWSRNENKQGISRSRFIHVIEYLEKDGWIDLFLGSSNSSWSITSFCVFTAKMDELLSPVNYHGTVPLYPHPIEIHHRQDKRLLPTRGVSGVSELAEAVDIYNMFIFDKRIEVNGTPVSTQQYKRSFLDNLNNGGRYYNVTGGVQTMNKEQRSVMTIDGEPIVELDFKAMHVSILYESLYASNPVEVEDMLSEWGEYDPYHVECIDGLILEDTEEAKAQLRSLCKWAILVGLNGADEISCRRALLFHYRKNYDKYSLLHYEDKFPTGNIFNAVKDRNYLLADRFFSDVGVVLQRLDGDIMSEIIEYAVNNDVTILPYHDSVVCPASNKEDVMNWMRLSYKKVIGGDKFCFIEEKKYA